MLARSARPGVPAAGRPSAIRSSICFAVALSAALPLLRCDRPAPPARRSGAGCRCRRSPAPRPSSVRVCGAATRRAPARGSRRCARRTTDRAPRARGTVARPSGSRSARRPSARAAAVRSASLRCASASPSSRAPASPAPGSSPTPVTAASRARLSPPRSIDSKIGSTSRAPAPDTPGQDARRLGAHGVCDRSSTAPRTMSSAGGLAARPRRAPPPGARSRRRRAAAWRSTGARPELGRGATITRRSAASPCTSAASARARTLAARDSANLTVPADARRPHRRRAANARSARERTCAIGIGDQLEQRGQRDRRAWRPAAPAPRRRRCAPSASTALGQLGGDARRALGIALAAGRPGRTPRRCAPRRGRRARRCAGTATPRRAFFLRARRNRSPPRRAWRRRCPSARAPAAAAPPPGALSPRRASASITMRRTAGRTVFAACAEHLGDLVRVRPAPAPAPTRCAARSTSGLRILERLVGQRRGRRACR